MIEKVGCGLSLLNASRHYSGGGTPESDLWIRRFLVMLAMHYEMAVLCFLSAVPATVEVPDRKHGGVMYHHTINC